MKKVVEHNSAHLLFALYFSGRIVDIKQCADVEEGEGATYCTAARVAGISPPSNFYPVSTDFALSQSYVWMSGRNILECTNCEN